MTTLTQSNIIIGLLLFFAGMTAAGYLLMERKKIPSHRFELTRFNTGEYVCLVYWLRISDHSSQGEWLVCGVGSKWLFYPTYEELNQEKL